MLWDVDGTLLRTNGVAQEAFATAVSHVLGRPTAGHAVAMSGKTDPLIALELMAAAGVADDEARGHLPACLARLEAELAGAAGLMRRQGHLLPGVSGILELLANEESVLQSVLTGNTAANAAVKLSAFGIDRWLDLEVGAFGSDHADRRRLVPVAVERARLRRGRSFTPGEVWVVGDTPRDLACARAAGSRCLLVATGRIPLEELRAAQPDAVLVDLSDSNEVLEIVLS